MQANDSIVINVEIPEMYEKRDDIDMYNYNQLCQLSNGYIIDPTKKNGLYYDLKFEDGVCVRDYEVEFGRIEESILQGNMETNMNLIMEKDDVPKNTLIFIYNANFYNISISNDYDLSYLKNKETKKGFPMKKTRIESSFLRMSSNHIIQIIPLLS